MVKQVKVYSTPTCPHCIRLKQYLKENNVVFEDIDVSSDHQAAEDITIRTGQMGVPVLDIEGQLIIGFDRELIKEALDIVE